MSAVEWRRPLGGAGRVRGWLAAWLLLFVCLQGAVRCARTIAPRDMRRFRSSDADQAQSLRGRRGCRSYAGWTAGSVSLTGRSFAACKVCPTRATGAF